MGGWDRLTDDQRRTYLGVYLAQHRKPETKPPVEDAHEARKKRLEAKGILPKARKKP